MNASENSQNTLCQSAMQCLRPHWKIIRDGFPLALFGFLDLVAITTMLVLSAHDSLDSLDIVSLFIAADHTFIEIVHTAAGQAIQVNGTFINYNSS